jgi:hypothetical protein
MVGERGAGVNLPAGGEKIGLPTRVFLFTLDQISVMTDISEKTLRGSHVFYQGRSIGSRKKSLLLAVNIAPEDEKPDWRITEREFIRWMRVKGFRYYERGSFH